MGVAMPRNCVCTITPYTMRSASSLSCLKEREFGIMNIRVQRQLPEAGKGSGGLVGGRWWWLMSTKKKRIRPTI